MLIALIAWIYTAISSAIAATGGASLWKWFSLLGMHFFIAAALARLLESFPIEIRWRYRLAFGVSLGLLPFAALAWRSDLLWLLALSLAAVLGAFGGGLWATARREGLWENNQPPSAQVQGEVLAKHRRVLRDPPPRSPGKRIFDLLLAAAGLVLTLPVSLLSLLLVWLEDPGPLFFTKNSVGQGGINFQQYKLRTMIRDAEQETGPVMSQEADSRVLRIGRLLRKTALDELPQLWNILRGEMSFVGPRPQRTVLVNSYLDDLPEYASRHAVLPGLAGLAQVVGHYYLTPHQKLRLDRLYARYASLGFDLKLIAVAILLVFWLRWKPDWNGRIPRSWIRFRPGQS